jgi:gliding motility-associated-like protein
MKKHFPILILLLFIFITAHAQEFYICTGPPSGTPIGTGVSTLRKVQLPTCTSQLKATLSAIFNDITFHPSGKLYGILQDGALYQLDTITGQSQLVANLGTGTLRANFNALTANAQGIIYAAADNGKLMSYNPQTNLVMNLGTIQTNGAIVVSAGDLTFYRGDLYIASTRTLVKIDLNNPANSSVYMNFNVSNEIYGIVSFAECGSVSTYATTGDAAGIVYKIDWTNRVLVNVCRTNYTIYGGASLYEFKASVVSLDTTRITNYTCDINQAVVLPPRVLRNQFGCDSLVFERTDYIKPDTLINASITCDRSQVRADTVRLRNFRGCDSLVITSVRYGADSVNLSRQICRGDSVNFYNQWYKQTGNYAKTFAKATGCDSVITLKLTVFDKQTTVKDSFVCQSNQVKRDTVLLRTFIGCDSFVIRNQLIAPRINERTPINKQICKGDYVSIGPNRFYTEGSFPVVLKNVYGCDSTINLTVRFLRSDSIISISETCDKSLVKDSINFHKNQFGCDSLIYIRATLIPNLSQVNNLPREVSIVIGDSFELKPQFNFVPSVITWTPNNFVNCPNCPSIFARPSVSTILSLYATDKRGCDVRQDIRFRVDLNRRVYIPNSFSPNNDKINDVFTLYGDGNLQSITTLKIFDRWGEMVFSGSNLTPNTEGWDGQYKGQFLTPDVYVFYAQLRFKDGETVDYKGEINLIK